jgi:hypothetical protein
MAYYYIISETLVMCEFQKSYLFYYDSSSYQYLHISLITMFEWFENDEARGGYFQI